MESSVLSKKRLLYVNLGLGGLLLLVMAISLTIRVEHFSINDLWNSSKPYRNQAQMIYFGARLPRILLGVLAGVALSTAGVAFQALLRNPLADPYVLGVTGGASLGGIVGLTFHSMLPKTPVFEMLQPHFVTLCAFGGAFSTMSLIYVIARESSGRLSVYSLLLSGVIFTSFTTALIMFINSLADFQQAHEILLYLMGNIGVRSYSTIIFFGVYVLIGVTVLFRQTHCYNALSLGEESALALGVPVEKTKKTTFIAASLLVGAVVATCGMIGFVGLVIPHMIRLVFGPDHRLLFPASAIFGAAFLVATDCLARTLLFPAELPVGIITALLGGPFFIYLLRRRSIVI